MKTKLTMGILAATALVASARPASAEPEISGPVVVGIFALISVPPAIDLGFSIHDAVVDHSSKGSAVAEVLLTAPQVAGGIAIASQRHSTSDKAIWLALSAWPAALTAHGIYVLAQPDATEPPTWAQPKRGWTVAPTPVSDGTQVAPGLVAVGRF